VGSLQGLKLITAKRESTNNPVIVRRHKMIGRLNEQIELAQATLEQRAYIKQRLRSVKDQSGVRSTVATQVRVKQWWSEQDNGKLALFIRYGSKIIALSAKSNAVECASVKDVLAALQVVKSAVEAGELDAQIGAASDRLRDGFKQ
jgi:hypothetical protein